MAVKLAHVDTDDVVKKYRAGISVKDIARDLGVDISVIYSRLDCAGVKREWRKTIDADKAFALYEQGVSIKEIGRMFGVSSYPVRSALLSKGVKLRGRIEQLQLARNKAVADIIAMNNSGMLASAIAAKLGMTISNMTDIMKANGIVPNNRAIDIPVVQITDLHAIGFSVAEIASMFDVSDKAIIRIMDANGANRRRTVSENRRFNASIRGFDIDSAKAMFDSGIGIRGIAENFGVPVSTARLAFQEAGFALRNRSEQQFARMAKASPEEKSAITRAANIAATGRVVQMGSKIKTANTCQSRLNRRMSIAESTFAEMLRERGISISQQTAVGPYNCDLTTDSVAVEIWGGYWHFYGEHAARNEERFRYILNSGWNVIILGITAKFPLSESVADYVVSEIQRLRRNPPSIREYRMIWGAGDFTSGGSLDDDKLSFVRPLIRPRNTSTN